MRFWLTLAAAVGAMLCIGAGTATASVHYQVVTTIGAAAPGGGTFINDFEPGSINDRGDFAFLADTSTPAGGGEGGFVSRAGALRQLVRTGDPLPGGNTVGFGLWQPLTVNAAGNIAGAVILDPFVLPFGMNSGIYRWTAPALRISTVMQPGDPAPGGGTFEGVSFDSDMNTGGDIVFSGIVTTALGVHVPGEPYDGIGAGIYRASPKGTISKIVAPGDPAPGGTFDFARAPVIDSGGDIAFAGHRTGTPCLQSIPQAVQLGCPGGVYFRDASSGLTRRIAVEGDPAPGGGTIFFAGGPLIDDRGDVVYFGRLGPSPATRGLYFASRSGQVAIARPGDPMPGGGNCSCSGNAAVNNAAQVVFSAALDTDVNGDGLPDNGLYLWQRGTLSLVARTGTVVPGLGTIAHIQSPANVGGLNIPGNGLAMNSVGQILFQATTSNGTGALLVADTG